MTGALLAKPDLRALLASWELSLRAERKSPQTVKSYGDGVRRFLEWAATANRSAELNRATVAAFTAGMLDNGAQATTARARQLAVRRFSAWLAEEGEIPRDELIGVSAPKLDAKVLQPLTDDQLRAMLKTCPGLDPLRDRRDAALIRLMVETGCRAGETADMRLSDLSLSAGVAVVRRVKGGKGRSVPFGPQTAKAIDPLRPHPPHAPPSGHRRALAWRSREAVQLRRTAQDVRDAR